MFLTEFHRYILNNPGLKPIHKQPWYSGFVSDMRSAGHTEEEIARMLEPSKSTTVHYKRN